MKTSKFRPGDRVVYTGFRGVLQLEEGTVTSVSDRWVFVCYGLPGSTSQATKPEDLVHVCERDYAPDGAEGAMDR